MDAKSPQQLSTFLLSVGLAVSLLGVCGISYTNFEFFNYSASAPSVSYPEPITFKQQTRYVSHIDGKICNVSTLIFAGGLGLTFLTLVAAGIQALKRAPGPPQDDID